MESWVPTGMVSRRPMGRSAEATQTRHSPWRRKTCELSPGGITQGQQHRPGGSDQPVLAGSRGQFHQAAAQHKPALDVPSHQTVVHQGESQAVHRGPRQAGGGYELRQGCGSGFECIKHHRCFIDDAHTA